MVLQGMINELAKDEDKEKYARFLLRAYVEGSKKVIGFNNLTDSPISQFFGPALFLHCFGIMFSHRKLNCETSFHAD